jgi:hypothetical protein
VTLVRRLATSLVALTVAAPTATGAQELFKKAEPLEVTITTGLTKLTRDRDSTSRVMHSGELAYKDSSGNEVKLAVALRTRGHFRRQMRNCDFPPLKVEIAKAEAKNTIFQGNHSLKLATSCRPSDSDYQQYILQEAAVFGMYEILTPWSYRVRLAHVTYRDSAGKAKPVTSWAFFIEDESDLAKRQNAKKFEAEGGYFADLEPAQWGIVQLFQYMTGNTDWSVAGLHNMTLLRDAATVIYPVPYDFDWTGAVNARYSFPDASLPIHSVRERLWRGDCRPVEQLVPTFELFASRRAAMDSTYSTITAMTPAVKERMRKYFDEFWTLIGNPKKAASEFKRTCGERH